MRRNQYVAELGHPDGRPSTARPSRRLLPTAGAAATATGVVLSMGTLAGCAESSNPLAGAAAAQSWTEPQHYAYTLRSACGERGGLGLFRLWVRDGDVERAQPLTAYSDLGPLSEMPTVGDLIRLAAEAQAGGADDVRVARAPDGQPRSVTVDYLENAMDDEACYRVSRLAVLD
jgi:hypothetical protein